MEVKKLEFTTDYNEEKIIIKTETDFDIYDVNCMMAELGPEEYTKLMSEYIADKILKELERRIG